MNGLECHDNIRMENEMAIEGEYISKCNDRARHIKDIGVFIEKSEMHMRNEL